MIVIPMAGLSRRFTEAGYSLPKYMLEAHGQTLFAHAVGSFAAYFLTEPFLFIVRDVADTPRFVREECERLGIERAEIAVLDANTRGQAETVAIGLDAAAVSPDTPITIFNIDTFRPNFRFPDFQGRITDGYLEVFRGSGANWSYVRPVSRESDIAAETAEKQPISDLCCTGLYQFGSADLYRRTYARYLAEFEKGTMLELYIAPMYNLLIQDGKTIRYTLIAPDEVIFCGVPAEYEAFLVSGHPASERKI